MYAAELAGLGYNLANTKYGITLGIKVPSNFCLWVKGIMGDCFIRIVHVLTYKIVGLLMFLNCFTIGPIKGLAI